MGYGRRRLFRNLWGSLGVAAIVTVIGIGLPALNSKIPGVRPVSDREAYLVGAGVAVIPPPGSSLDATKTRPGPLGGQVLFYVGTVRYALVVAPFTGSLGEATTSLRSRITHNRGFQVAGPESAIVTRSGVQGRQGMYSSFGRDGRYVVFVAHGLAVDVTIAGTDIDLRPLLPMLNRSVSTIAFGAS
jgi:hypothetical protein